MADYHYWTCSCGAQQAMTKETYSVLKSSAATFYCVHGHTRWFPPGKSEEDKLREELEAERRQRQRAEQSVAFWQDEAKRERNRANGYKGHATRITKRAKAGICPCCNRHFIQLERHMANKHPDFTPLADEVTA